MTQSVLDIILRTKKTGNADLEAQKGLKGLSGAFKDLTGFSLSSAAALGAVSAAVGAGIKFTKEAITETVNYNKEIRELTQITGLGAEETSRLVQAADDWGISIGDIRTALQMAVKNGFEPTIDNLATMADEYVNAEDKTAFAAQATEIFGRQWTTLIPLLSGGGDALREQAAAVDESLIATEEAIAASREYELAMDEMTDAVEGLKLKIGNDLIPVMTSFITLTNDMINLDADTWFEDGADAAAQFINKVIYGKDTVFDFTTNMSNFKDEIWLGVEATDALAAATDEASGKEDSYTGVMKLAKDALSEFNIGAATKLQLLEDIALATGETTAEEIALKDAVDFLTRMLADGKLTQEDYIELVQQLALDGSLAAEIVKGLGNAILLLPDSKDIHINVKYHKYGPEPGPDVPVIVPDEPYVPGPGGQMGGQVWPWRAVRWQEPAAGSEIMISNRQGYILNMRQAQDALAGSMGGGTQTVNNFYLSASYANMQSEASLSDDIRMLMTLYGS